MFRYLGLDKKEDVSRHLKPYKIRNDNENLRKVISMISIISISKECREIIQMFRRTNQPPQTLYISSECDRKNISSKDSKVVAACMYG